MCNTYRFSTAGEFYAYTAGQCLRTLFDSIRGQMIRTDGTVGGTGVCAVCVMAFVSMSFEASMLHHDAVVLRITRVMLAAAAADHGDHDKQNSYCQPNAHYSHGCQQDILSCRRVGNCRSNTARCQSAVVLCI